MWLVWALQATLPKWSPWRTAQFDTIRLLPIRIAACVDEPKKHGSRPLDLLVMPHKTNAGR
jgi:hypothetical protein